MKKTLAAILVLTLLLPLAGFSSNMFTQQAAIEETVLVDESGVKITATELTYTDYEAELSLLIENNSEKDLSFRTGTVAYACNSVNGYMFEALYLNTDVPAGKKSNETLRFDADELQMMGITDIADIELGFDITDSDYDTYLQTGPISLKTPLADTYDYVTDTYQEVIGGGVLADTYGASMDHFSADTLYNQDGVRLLSEALATNKDGDTALFLEFENTGAEPVNVVIGNFALNGLVIQGPRWDSSTVNPGKRGVMLASLSSMLDSTYWDVYGLEEIGDVTFTVTLEDADYDTIRDPETVSVIIPGAQSSINAEGSELYAENGIRVVFKGLVPDSSSYSDDVHALLLIENGTDQEISVDDEYDSLSVNGFMTDYLCYSTSILAGYSAVLDVEIQDSSLEENKIDGIDAIEEVEMQLEFRDANYDEIATPVITASLTQ